MTNCSMCCALSHRKIARAVSARPTIVGSGEKFAAEAEAVPTFHSTCARTHHTRTHADTRTLAHARMHANAHTHAQTQLWHTHTQTHQHKPTRTHARARARARARTGRKCVAEGASAPTPNTYATSCCSSRSSAFVTRARRNATMFRPSSTFGSRPTRPNGSTSLHSAGYRAPSIALEGSLQRTTDNRKGATGNGQGVGTMGKVARNRPAQWGHRGDHRAASDLDELFDAAHPADHCVLANYDMPS
jgi:hypothetical protein